MPKFSVIMNCHNGEKYLREAIDSVYTQTFQDWEIIFWDNVSTDSTAEIAQSYDGRLRYFRGSSMLTLGAARKAAVKEASSDWIAFLDCDDYWYKNKLELQSKGLEGKDYILGYAGINEITMGGSLIRGLRPQHRSGYIFEKLLYQFEVHLASSVVRRQALEFYDFNFDEAMTMYEEYNLFMRLAAKGKVLAMQDIVAAYRIGPGTLSHKQLSKLGVERHHTLNQLKEDNPGIEKLYPQAFREAHARGKYYEARYLVSVGMMKEAKQAMHSISGVDYRYRFLWLALSVPGLWNLIHSDFIRRKILLRVFAKVRT